MKNEADYTLYLVTDRDPNGGEDSIRRLENAVAEAIAGGVTMVQLREKTTNSRAFYELAMRLHKITSQAEIPLIINDRADIALAMNAEGVHVGASDIPCDVLRKILGANKIIGVSASNLAQAKQAQAEGADYLGIGAMYATGTKPDATITTKQELLQIRAAISIPLVVIGGINESTIPDFRGTRIDGIAVVSAILSAPHVTAASQSLKKLFESTCQALS
ncbi:MAG: thiamine phosphate synthase [Lachnospiraceae bacterium]|nr:thiamine phosphate synthase [Lachnospiraceae bacterium]